MRQGAVSAFEDPATPHSCRWRVPLLPGRRSVLREGGSEPASNETFAGAEPALCRGGTSPRQAGAAPSSSATRIEQRETSIAPWPGLKPERLISCHVQLPIKGPKYVMRSICVQVFTYILAVGCPVFDLPKAPVILGDVFTVCSQSRGYNVMDSHGGTLSSSLPGGN